MSKSSKNSKPVTETYSRRNSAIFSPFQLAVKSPSTFSQLVGIKLFHCGFWRNLTKFTSLVTRLTKEATTTRFSSRSEQLATQLLLSMTLWSNALSFSCNFYFLFTGVLFFVHLAFDSQWLHKIVNAILTQRVSAQIMLS